MKTQSLVKTETEVKPRRNLTRISEVARSIARQQALKQYQDTLAMNTKKTQYGHLKVFSEFLREAGEPIEPKDLMLDLRTWEGANEGILVAFKEWMLQRGYAIGSVNIRLSTIKKYCEIAASAGFLDPADLGLIKSVYGYRGKEGRNVDANRTVTRVGNKKKKPTIVTNEQLMLLLDQDNSRDTLLMYLFIRLGFRVGEVASLNVSDFDLDNGEVHLYRQKSDLHQTHELTYDGVSLVRQYLSDYPVDGRLFQADIKEYDDGSVSTDYTIRAIQHRVKKLGQRVGIEQLSPHDLRHDLATRLARNNTPIKVMQTTLGHSTPFMSLSYVEAQKIANKGALQ